MRSHLDLGDVLQRGCQAGCAVPKPNPSCLDSDAHGDGDCPTADIHSHARSYLNHDAVANAASDVYASADLGARSTPARDRLCL